MPYVPHPPENARPASARPTRPSRTARLHGILGYAEGAEILRPLPRRPELLEPLRAQIDERLVLLSELRQS